MNDFACITMHRSSSRHLAAEDGCNSLMSEANPQDRNRGIPNHIARNAEIPLAHIGIMKKNNGSWRQLRPPTFEIVPNRLVGMAAVDVKKIN